MRQVWHDIITFHYFISSKYWNTQRNKFFPIFITGDPYLDTSCPLHNSYSLDNQLSDVKSLQLKYPIYQEEWLWIEVKNLYKEPKGEITSESK